MTICIAALADNRKKLVLAADQMITANIPMPYQFETDDVKKIYDLTDNAVLLTAGNALFAYEIYENALKNIGYAKVRGEQIGTIKELAEIVRVEYQNYRRDMAVKSVLEPRGLTLNDYYDRQQKLNIGIIQEIENQLVNLNIAVDLIIAGHNMENECHIYSITHPGILVLHDALGYVCVGTGAPHATYNLIGSNYKKSLNDGEVKKLIEEAKKKSEVAPGVGKATTIVVLPKAK